VFIFYHRVGNYLDKDDNNNNEFLFRLFFVVKVVSAHTSKVQPLLTWQMIARLMVHVLAERRQR